MKELKYRKTFINKGVLTNVFIPTDNEWKSTEKENLSIIESGKEGVLFKKIINDIKSAKEMICLQSFLIQDTEIIDAILGAKRLRGVKVFVLDSAEARLNNSGFEEDDSFATKDYKKMLEEKFKNNFVHRQAHNLHSKFILIDPKTNPKGYIFTGNFNQKPFFENPELAVPLDETQTNELFNVFVYHFWEHTTDEQTSTNQFDKVKPIGKFERPVLKTILVTSPKNELSNLKTTLVKAIENAKNEIVFSTFGFDINHKLSQSILTKLEDGINVTVFCRPREKAIKGNLELLAKKGAKVICHPLIHAKSLILDGSDAFVFTANFEKHGMDTGFETGIRLNKKQTADLKLIIENWRKSFPYIYEYEKAISDVNEYMDFSDTRKNRTIITDKIVSKTKEIQTVNDLLIFINSLTEPSNFSEKKYIIESTIKLKELNKYKLTKSLISGINLVEYEINNKKKTKKENALLFDVSLVKMNHETIDLLKKKYNNFKIFGK